MLVQCWTQEVNTMAQPTIGITVRVEVAQAEKAKKAAQKQGVSLAVWVRNAMAAALKP
jgi:predicted HicB family RNase H-like nuclease